MGAFRRGAFALADELQLPVVPLTINGSFNIMPRMRDGKFVIWHPLSLTIHQPIYPVGKGDENITATMNITRTSETGLTLPVMTTAGFIGIIQYMNADIPKGTRNM